MKTLIAILSCLLAIAYAIRCPNTPKYTTYIKDESLCTDKTLGVLWPNYKNVSEYYRCQGVGNPVLEQCPDLYSIFDYTKQTCSRCDRYVPTPECKIIRPNECVDFTPDPIVDTCELREASYTKGFVPTCKGNDTYTYWPYYSRNFNDVSKNYYYCQYEGATATKKHCPDDTYFSFYAQMCVDCASYWPPPPCDKLTFNKPNSCSNL